MVVPIKKAALQYVVEKGAKIYPHIEEDGFV
jgi:hypothetical protein